MQNHSRASANRGFILLSMMIYEYKSDFDCLGFSGDLVSRLDGKCVLWLFCSCLQYVSPRVQSYLFINPTRNSFHEERTGYKS